MEQRLPRAGMISHATLLDDKLDLEQHRACLDKSRGPGFRDHGLAKSYLSYILGKLNQRLREKRIKANTRRRLLV